MRDSVRLPDAAPPRRLEGRHVLILFCLFFGAIFAVNGYFLYSALATHTGVVSVEPYRKGLAYNDRIAAGERQAAGGWRDDVSISADGTVVVKLLDAAGVPVSGLAITGVVGRGASARTDRVLTFSRDGAVYRANVPTALEPGTWLVAFEARRNPANLDPDYRARRRVWLKQ